MSARPLTKSGTRFYWQNSSKIVFLGKFWICLHHRKQIVVVDGKKSEVQPVNAGIPLGSKLSPLLCLLYNNDITENIEGDILIYADDTSLFANAEILNTDLARITAWSLKWKITFNTDKSTNIIFSNKYLNISPPLIFNNKYVQSLMFMDTWECIYRHI